MTLGDKIRSLRSVEGSLRGMGRAMTQFELAQAMKRELGRGLSQAYLSQIESGARPHLTHTTRKQLAGWVRQMGPGATLDLREIRLAQSAPDLILHSGGQFLLRHRTTQAAERTFHRAEGTEFVAKFHGEPIYCNLQI